MRLRGPRWFSFGICGALVLSLATAIKAVVSLPLLWFGQAEWHELPGFAAWIAAVGFACGAVAELLSFLPRSLGRWGDGLLGIAVFELFFVLCALRYMPEAFSHPRLDRSLFVFVLPLAVGLYLGLSVGGEHRAQGGEP